MRRSRSTTDNLLVSQALPDPECHAGHLRHGRPGLMRSPRSTEPGVWHQETEWAVRKEKMYAVMSSRDACNAASEDRAVKWEVRKACWMVQHQHGHEQPLVQVAEGWSQGWAVTRAWE